jgi:hypothetical protein
MINFKFFVGYQKERTPVVNINTRRRSFWTPDLITDIARHHTPHIEDEIVHRLSQELSEELDRRIIDMITERI